MGKKIVRLTGEPGEDDGLEEVLRDADVVIDEDNVVIKDRHGAAPRVPTMDELAEARPA